MLSIPLLLGVALAGGQEPSLRPGDVALIEAEAATRRTPDDGSFARPHAARWASGRTCLVAFFGQGRAAWSFRLDEAGVHRVWLRYAARTPATLHAGVDVPEDAELAARELAATGATEGKHAWAWGLVFEGELEAGAHELVLAAAPLRPDCLLVTTEEGVPDLLQPPPAPTHDEETLARIRAPLVPLGARGGEVARILVDWFENERVQAHTRLARAWVDDPLFEEAEAALAEIGVRVLGRHVKPFGGGAWWPSEVGAVEPVAAERDLVREMVQRAHASGLKLIAYYRHGEDAGAAAEHPDWVCLDDRGQPILRNGSPRLCFNSPYLELVRTRLVELGERGVDGLYLDEDHVPLEGCWCAWCREAFTRETGLPHPVAADEEDPLYRKLRAFMDLTVERTLARIRIPLELSRPNVMVLVSSHLQPDLIEPHPSMRLLRLADSVKTEYGIGAGARSRAFFARHPDLTEPPRDARLALGWALSRDGARGRPPHVWIHGLTDPLAAQAATAAVIAYGGIANLDMPEESIPDAETFGPALTLGERLSRAYSGTRPLRFAALHVPERARAALEPDEAAVWRELMGPVVEAWTALVRARVPVTLVTDDQLVTPGWIDGHSVLLVPATHALEPGLIRQVERFRARGGLVVELGPDGLQLEGVLPELARRLEALDAAALVEAPERVHATFFRGQEPERLVVGLVNDFAWVWTERRQDAGGRTLPLPEGVDVPPAPVEGTRVELRMASPPESVLDAATGERLEVTREGERAFVEVPAFDVASVLVVEL